MYLQTQGFILKSKNLREVDRQYTLFTQAGGKLEVTARGIRKLKSKLAGHLQQFSLIDFNLVRGKLRWQLIGASMLRNFQFSIFNFQTSIGYGYYFLELVDKLTREHQPYDEVYTLSIDSLKLLEQIDSEEQLKRLRVAFLLKTLKATGFNPEKRLTRQPNIQNILEYYLHEPLAEITALTTNGELKSLFNISQYALNEVISEPLHSVRFLQSLK
jgi:DNA repair protein RecO (recombination protein O)